MEEFEIQLELFVKNYIELRELMKDSITSELIEARCHLLSAILSISSFINIEKFEVGTVCYAPRLVERTMDLALIISKIDDDLCLILWLYPRNNYELTSQGIRMDVSRLRHYTELDHQERLTNLQNLPIGGLVLFQNDKGIFLSGEIFRKMTKGLSLTNEKILEIKSENPVNLRTQIFTVSEDILIVTPFIAHQSLAQILKPQRAQSDEEVKGGEIGNEIDENNSVLTLSNSQSNNQGQDNLIGGWEKHTRGVGSRLLEKMGYVK